MWLLRGALLGAVLVALHDATADPQYEDTEDDDGDDVDFDDHYDSEDIITATAVTATDEPGAHSRVRRFGDYNPGERTLSLEEISDVKGAIKELLAGRYQDLTTTSFTIETGSSEAATDVNEPATKDPAFTGLTKIDNVDPTKYYEDIIEEIIDNAKRQGLYVPTRKANIDVDVTNNYIHVEKREHKLKTEARPMKAVRLGLTKVKPESGNDMLVPRSGNYITNIDVDVNNNYFQVERLPNNQKTNARVTRSLSKANPERNSDIPMPVEFEDDVVNIDADENNNYVQVGGPTDNPNTEAGLTWSARLEPSKAKPQVISKITLPSVLTRTIYVEKPSRSTGKNKVTENYENDVSEAPENYNAYDMNFRRLLNNTEADGDGGSGTEAPTQATVAASIASNIATNNIATSNDAKSNDATSNDATSNDATSNDATSNDAKSNDAKSNDATSNDATSNDAKSNDATSNDATSNDATSNDATSNDAKSNDAKSNDATSNDATSNDATSNRATRNDATTNDATNNNAITNSATSDESSIGSVKSDIRSTTTTEKEVTTIETTTTPSTRRRTRRRRTTTKPTTTTETTTTVTTSTTSTTTPLPDFDIPALVDIIANLTYDFESNITMLFNKTLQKYNIPTCRTPETTTTEKVIFDLRNATVVSKCFVCGMHVEGIPPNALCADAFAGDFLPLVPVDQRAKGQLAQYRKYCRYLDVNGFYENSTEPRSVFGRFTGGCSVRWTDLSGVYTQRACRNTRRAMTGRHFGSKRMAKLEMALKDYDNGCIISPMSSLVPLSRGISLYARFHACVCTGNWCNAASPVEPWMAFIAVVALLGLTMSTGSSIRNMFFA